MVLAAVRAERNKKNMHFRYIFDIKNKKLRIFVIDIKIVSEMSNFFYFSTLTAASTIYTLLITNES